MTIMYKLVTQEMTTHGGMKWVIGKTNKATGIVNEMCSDGVLHCYADPYLAVMFNPIHANINNPKLLEIECSNIVATDGLKHACKEQRPVKELTLPILTKEQRVAFSIKCALLVFKQDWFVKWAEGWLSGSDRSESAAESAAWSAWSARSAPMSAESAAWSAAESAWSARSAPMSARSAPMSARSAPMSARSAPMSARSAAWSAARSAESAAWSARSAESAARSAESAAWSEAHFKEIMQWVLDNIS